MSLFPTSLAGGRYLLVKPLGEGGMATVFRAFDQRLQVWRAVKILSAEFSAKPRLRQRFEAEAQTMALLEHKHIVRVYDVGSDGETAYIVMEIVEGGSLVDWIDKHGPMPPRLAVDVTIELSEGIAAAHAKGVIHRDIKPHNVLVTRDGSCRVTDFGIAQVSSNDASITRTGAVMGTWGYMAPEQRTNAKGVDERADVYSTASSLFTLLTGKLPMDLFAADRDDPMLEGVHPEIVPVLIKASEYKREHRYANMAELCDALRELRRRLPENPSFMPPLAHDPGPPPPAPRPEDYQVAASRTGATAVPPDEEEGSRHTIALDDPWLLAPTMAPEVDTLNGEGPRIKDKRLFEPARSGRSSVVRAGFVLGWLGAVGLLGFGVLLIAVAGGIYFTRGGTDAVASTDPAPVIAEPPRDPKPKERVGIVVTPKDVVATAAEPPTDAVPKKPIPREVVKKPPVEPRRDPGATDPKPVVVVVAPPADPPAPAQCVKVTPPASTSIGTDLVVKAALCAEDGTPVTLWYRPAGGTWQSKMMPKALGAHTTKIPIDASYNYGVEFYVEAGAASKGSATAPMTVAVR